MSILSLAARRKGIARFAALHLDCARFADGMSLSVRVGKAVANLQQASLKPFAGFRTLSCNPIGNRGPNDRSDKTRRILVKNLSHA